MPPKSDPTGLPPVSLPAGSYDHETLHRGFAAAAKAKPEDYEAKVVEAVDGAAQTEGGVGSYARDPASIPGHAVMDVLTEHGVQQQQIYVPPAEPEPLPEPVDQEKLAQDIEKTNVKNLKTQAAEAVKAGEVAPDPEPEAPAPADVPAAAPGAAPAGEDKK